MFDNGTMISDNCPAYSPFFGVLGATCAMVFTAMGASYGTAKASIGISASAVLKPEFIIKSVIPIVMAGIIAIYGLVVAVLITNSITESYSLLT